MVLNNLFSSLYHWLPGFARRVFCPLYLRDAAVYERNQQALQVKMTVEIEWGTRLHPPAKPGATQAGGHTANATAALRALQCSMAPRRLCSLCALPTLQRKLWFAALFCLEQVAISEVPGQVEWVHPCSLCHPPAPASAALPVPELPELVLLLPSPAPVWEPEQITGCAELCTPTHQLTVLVYLMQLRVASSMPPLTWSCCKHTLPLCVD